MKIVKLSGFIFIDLIEVLASLMQVSNVILLISFFIETRRLTGRNPIIRCNPSSTLKNIKYCIKKCIDKCHKIYLLLLRRIIIFKKINTQFRPNEKKVILKLNFKKNVGLGTGEKKILVW